MFSIFRLGALSGVLSLSFVVGCGSPKGGEMGQSPAELREISDMLRQAGAASGKAPGKAADLDRFKGDYVLGHQAVKSGKVMVIWNTPLAGEGDAGKNEVPLAYEKEVPSAGGYVLFSAGTIKKLTADEFNAAKK